MWLIWPKEGLRFSCLPKSCNNDSFHVLKHLKTWNLILFTNSVSTKCISYKATSNKLLTQKKRSTEQLAANTGNLHMQEVSKWRVTCKHGKVGEYEILLQETYMYCFKVGIRYSIPFQVFVKTHLPKRNACFCIPKWCTRLHRLVLK